MSNHFLASNGSTISVIQSGTLVGNVNLLINAGRYSTGAVPGHWLDSNPTPSVGTPTIVEVTLPTSELIDEIIIFNLNDDYSGSRTTDPDTSENCTIYGMKDYKGKYWNGSSFVEFLSITNNGKVRREHAGLGITSNKFRFEASSGMAGGGYVGLCEIEGYTAPPDTTPPSDVTLGSTTALSATSARFAFTPATDNVAVAGLNWEYDTVNTFDSGDLIQEFVASNTSPNDKTGLLAGRRWYARAKAKDTASPPNLSTNWSNTVQVDLPPTINTASPLNNAIIGVPFSQTLAKTGASGTFAIQSGAPTGFSINSSTGEITWTPDALGTTTNIVIRYTVTASGLYAEVTYSITVVPAIVVPTSFWSKLQLVPLADCLFWNALDVAEDATEIGDYSGNGNELEVASSAPVLQSDVINGKPGVYFDGTKNPLKFEAEITLKHLFLIAKFDGAEFDGNEGLLSGVAATSILRGNGDTTTKFANLSIGGGYVYKKNFVTLTESTQNAPVNAFAILELIFPEGIELDGIQIGQDTTNTGRKWKGWFIEQIGYGEVQSDCNRRDIYEYFAMKFFLWRFNADGYPYFPFIFNRSSKHTKTDLAEISEAEGLRGRDRVVRYLNDESVHSYNLDFIFRNYLEHSTTEQFLEERRMHLPFWLEDIEREIERKVIRATELTDNGNGSAFKFDYQFGVRDY